MSRRGRELLPGDLVCVDLTSCDDIINPLDDDVPGIETCTPCNATPETVVLYSGDVLLYLGTQKCSCRDGSHKHVADMFLSHHGIVAPHRYGGPRGALYSWMRRI